MCACVIKRCNSNDRVPLFCVFFSGSYSYFTKMNTRHYDAIKGAEACMFMCVLACAWYSCIIRCEHVHIMFLGSCRRLPGVCNDHPRMGEGGLITYNIIPREGGEGEGDLQHHSGGPVSLRMDKAHPYTVEVQTLSCALMSKHSCKQRILAVGREIAFRSLSHKEQPQVTVL